MININVHGFQSPFYLKKGGIISGKIHYEYDEFIRRNNMDKNWKSFKIFEKSSYGLCTIKIYPKIFTPLMTKYYPGLRDIEKFRMTSFVYR
ncbi:hypothetical protein MXB_5095 [Myxobolus squamalis]|nr:hypothetical protein MXB_5095 [Myxobolus squamalis]